MSKIKVIMCPADRAPYVTNIEDSLENQDKQLLLRSCLDRWNALWEEKRVN